MRADVKFNIRDKERGLELAIGPGKVALLEAIAETGSIASAAKKLRMSYRRAWMLVDETNRCLIAPAVHTATGGKRGGGAALSPVGEELVRQYRGVERQAEAAVARKLLPLLRAVASNDRSRE